jgi:hypothetical protein
MYGVFHGSYGFTSQLTERFNSIAHRIITRIRVTCLSQGLSVTPQSVMRRHNKRLEVNNQGTTPVLTLLGGDSAGITLLIG